MLLLSSSSDLFSAPHCAASRFETMHDRWPWLALQRAAEAVELGFLGYADKHINASYSNATEYAAQRSRALLALSVCSDGNYGNGTEGGTAEAAWYASLLAGFPDPRRGAGAAAMDDPTNFLGTKTPAEYADAFKQAGYVPSYATLSAAGEEAGAREGGQAGW